MFLQFVLDMFSRICRKRSRKATYLLGHSHAPTVPRKFRRRPKGATNRLISGAWGTSSAQSEADCTRKAMSDSDVFSYTSSEKQKHKNSFVCPDDFDGIQVFIFAMGRVALG